MFVKLVLFVLVLHMREMKFHDDFVEDQMEENSQLWNVTRPFRRRMSQLSACRAKPDKCVDNCIYDFIGRGCYGPEAQQPGQTIIGVGVEDAVIEKYPFMLSLRIPRVDDSNDGITNDIVPNCYSHICGAVLIWRDIALTAAHCLLNDKETLITDEKPYSKFKTTLHVTRLSECRHQDGQEQRFAYEAIVHPEYAQNQRTFNNDIAIIKLRGDMSPDYGFINLWTSQQDENQWDTKILGFGATAFEKNFNNETTRLQVANLATMLFKTCKSWFESINETLSVNKLNETTMLCAQSYGADTCEGDSGGPLFLQEDDRNVSLIGIASWGSARQCEIIDQGQPPSVFAKIAFYKDWIIQNVNLLTVYGPYSPQVDTQGDVPPPPALDSLPPPLLMLSSQPPPTPETSGTLLKELGDFEELQDLLGLGQIGTLPKEISVLTNLEVLFFYSDGITGTIPGELSVLINLVELDLDGNSLTGTIPGELSVLTNLVELSLSLNSLTGTIPSELSTLVNIQRLWSRDNELTGTIPASFSALNSLQTLHLFSNSLTGTIPNLLSALTNLEYLYLYNNRLTGAIPKQLSALTKLQVMWLQNNIFTGTLPEEFSVLAPTDIRI